MEGYPALRLRAGQALAAKPLAQIAEKKTSQDYNTLSAGAAGGEGGDPRLPALSAAEGPALSVAEGRGEGEVGRSLSTEASHMLDAPPRAPIPVQTDWPK